MSFIARYKVRFNKENFDYKEGLVDPYEFHKTFHFFCKIFRVIDDENLPKWTYLPALLTITVGCLAATLFLITAIGYFWVFEIPSVTEAGTYYIVMTYKVLIASCTLTDKPHYYNLMKALRDDFQYICTKGSKYRVKYFENQMWTWKTTVLSGIFITIIAGGMAVCAIISLIFFICQSSREGIRPLPFPLMIPGVNLTETPMYEMAFSFSLVCVLSHAFTYIFMMQTQIVWVRQIMAKADIIIWSLEDLLLDIKPTHDKEQAEYYTLIIQARMRDIIKMHHSMYKLLADYSGVYRKLLMFEQKLCAPVVCLTAYCAAEKADDGELPGILLLLCSSVVILVFIPSYLCTLLADKVESIGDVCINIPFWNAPGRVIRPYLVLVMQRSMRTLSIQAPGFEEVSLETFSNKMTFAYTCFNMLRQADFDI